MKNILFLFPWWFFCYGNNIDIIAERTRALGDMNKSNAEAMVKIQSAAKANLENKNARIRERWKNQDEYKKRQVSALDKKEKRLDNIERSHALKQREEKLIASGALPARKESKLTILGQEFNSYEEFKKSVTYLRFKEEVAKRIALEKAEEIRKEIELQKLIFEVYSRTPIAIREKIRKDCQEISEAVRNDPWQKVIVERQEMSLEEIERWKNERSK